jgi:hypothetical protein
MAKRYKLCQHRGIMRIEGPGLSLYIGHLDCPGLVEVALNTAYQAGWDAGKKHEYRGGR